MGIRKTGKEGLSRRDGPPYDRQLRGRTSPTEAELPLLHVTSAWTAKEVVRASKLETRYCRHFQRDLLYFFVLRPAIRIRRGNELSHQLTRFPVAFVVRPGAAEPLHVYPFDTGGAVTGAFDDQANKEIPLEDYALDASNRAAAAFIKWAFGNINAYLEGRLRPSLLASVPRSEWVTHGYVDIARMGRLGHNKHDRRASTVEIAVGHDVDLAGNILLAILPKQLLEGDDELLAKLKGMGIAYETYDWQPNTRPDEYEQDIGEIIKAWIASQEIAL